MFSVCVRPDSVRVLITLVLASGIAACGSLQSPPRAGGPERSGSTAFRVPPERVPPQGRCAIWYPGVRADRQPPAMSCNKAHADAESWGGVVIWGESARARTTGEVAHIDYGPHTLRGIPPDRLPPPGQCRLWIEGIPAHLQPPPARCEQVEARQRVGGGRVLFMPATDIR